MYRSEKGPKYSIGVTKNSKKQIFYMLCLLPRSMSQKYLMKLITHTGCVVPYFKKIVNEHAPIKQKTIKGNHIPYMNGELRRAINVKRMLKRKFTKCNSNMNCDKYRKQRNIVTKLLKKSLQQYMHKTCNEAVNGRDFWKTVKPLISK